MTLEQKIERAKQIRKTAMMNAETLEDAKAAEVPTLYPVWEAGEAVEVDFRRYYEPDGKLYKCRQAHTTQEGWEPPLTPAVWAVVDVAHAGTPEDPIPASRGMDYICGKYYLDPEDEKIYLCKREGEAEGGVINLRYLPHELIGQYFEEVA